MGKWLLLLHDCLLFRFLKTFLVISFNGVSPKTQLQVYPLKHIIS